VRVAVLGSGSRGNSVLVSAEDTNLLVDAGFSARALAERLHVLGLTPDEVHGIVVTHDHGDHTRGMGVFARRHGTPLYMTEATRKTCERLLSGTERIVEYRANRAFHVGSLMIDPFVTVHDAADPVGVSVADPRTGVRLGVATDLGRPTAQIRHALQGCDILVLEANHDEVLLHASPYPASVKRRITSSHGHLSNQAAAQLALDLLHPRLACVVLAHLSQEANRPELALQVVGTALQTAGWRGHLEVAPQDRPTSLFDIEEIRRRKGPEQLTIL
jgi:phosphoribosyl 1,2-cyclic phosphodiesterase